MGKEESFNQDDSIYGTQNVNCHCKIEYITSLQIYDGDNKKGYCAIALKLLESNKKYKCSLVVPQNHPDVEELDFVKEYEFIVFGNKGLYNHTLQNSTENFFNNTKGNNFTNSTDNRSENITKNIKLVIYISIGIFGCLVIIAVTVFMDKFHKASNIVPSTLEQQFMWYIPFSKVLDKQSCFRLCILKKIEKNDDSEIDKSNYKFLLANFDDSLFDIAK
uniref:Tyrosine-protein phosphatase domain-containing protein n=1 Tax=Strongyloides papillosus TaxID=174720 RepID=A0A0N5BTB8_STREA